MATAYLLFGAFFVMLFAGVPIAHHLEVQEVAPLRTYDGFVEDVMGRWR